MISRHVARRVAEILERGDGPLPALLGAPWEVAARRSLHRTLPPCRARVVSVMGATLGGSWKTPVALAVASDLRLRGLEVAFVAHGHGAANRAPRIVSRHASPRDVGDEASMAARALAKLGVEVVLGSDLAAALDRLSSVDTAVLDAVARAPTRPGDVTLLAVDASRPWGSGATPPRGDLKARPSDLLRAASFVVAVHDARGAPPPLPRDLDGALRASFDLGGTEALDGARVALVTALARPERVARSLAIRGVNVVHHVALADHGGSWVEAAAVSELSRAPPFDVVATTEKCGGWLPERLLGRRVQHITLTLALPIGWTDALEHRTG